jgi:hypothetical protein
LQKAQGADIGGYGESESARVSAWNYLAEIFLLIKAKNLRDLNDFYGWTTDELENYAKTGKSQNDYNQSLEENRITGLADIALHGSRSARASLFDLS